MGIFARLFKKRHIASERETKKMAEILKSVTDKLMAEGLLTNDNEQNKQRVLDMISLFQSETQEALRNEVGRIPSHDELLDRATRKLKERYR